MLRIKTSNTQSYSHLILDTNIITRLSSINEKNEDDYDRFLDFLENKNLEPVITKSIRFEYLRGSSTASIKEDKENFLSYFSEIGEDLPIQGRMGEAIKIGNVYNNKNYKNIDMGDCFLAAQMKKYSDNTILATENLSDFPEIIFNRMGYCFYDTFSRDLDLFYFLKFNKENYSKILRNVNSN